MTYNFQNQIINDVDKYKQHTQIYGMLSAYSKLHIASNIKKEYWHEKNCSIVLQSAICHVRSSEKKNSSLHVEYTFGFLSLRFSL